MTASASASESITVRIGYVAPGELTVEPSMVHLTVGQSIRWIFASHASDAVQFEIDLHGTPFDHSSFREEVMALGIGGVDTGPAMRTGEYKYDVRVRGGGGRQLADDDPYIIVRPRNW